jgi:hypothetical protein
MGGSGNAFIAGCKEESRPDGPRCTAALSRDWNDAALHANGVLTDCYVGKNIHEILGVGVGIMCEFARVKLNHDVIEAAVPNSSIAKFPIADPTKLHVAHSLFFYPR